jgi:hypothetical protein
MNSPLRASHASIWIVVFLMAGFSDECRANLNGSDDFKLNSIGTNDWATPALTNNAGFLTQTNGRLEYTTKGVPTTFDLAALSWKLNFGSFTQSWEVQVDVNVPALPLDANQQVMFGLLACPGTNAATVLTDRFLLSLDQHSNERFFLLSLTTNGSSIEVATKATTSTNGAVRIAFDASSKVLSAFYNTNGPACAYPWRPLGEMNVPASWNMTGASVFGVRLFGFSQSLAVSSSNGVFGDNFCASSGATPRLGIRLGSGRVVISWSTNAPACHVESTRTLTPPICWQVTTNTPSIVSTNFIVTDVISSGNTFYRLSR